MALSGESRQEEHRKEISVKLAEKRFRAMMIANRDRLIFVTASFGFASILLLCLVMGKSPTKTLLYSSAAMLIMGTMGFWLGSVLLNCHFTDRFQLQHMGKSGQPRVSYKRMTISTDKLQPGMVLQKAALTRDGRQVLRGQTSLGPEEIARLQKEDVHDVEVVVEITEKPFGEEDGAPAEAVAETADVVEVVELEKGNAG